MCQTLVKDTFVWLEIVQHLIQFVTADIVRTAVMSCLVIGLSDSISNRLWSNPYYVCCICMLIS